MIHALRRKPLTTLSDEELRLALSQAVGLPWILELALTRLEDDPLRSGDFYAGDVLACLLRLPRTAWNGQSALSRRLRAVMALARSELPRLEEQEQAQIRDALDRFAAG